MQPQKAIWYNQLHDFEPLQKFTTGDSFIVPAPKSDCLLRIQCGPEFVYRFSGESISHTLSTATRPVRQPVYGARPSTGRADLYSLSTRCTSNH
jgi:hypothetical protein